MGLHIDAKSGVPIYVQLKNQIKYQIASGAIRRGDQLPTVRQLAVDLTINPNTVARVYLELEREGVLITQQGKGTFVAAEPDAGTLTAERRQKLREALRSAVVAGISLGFSLEEIEREFETAAASWRAQERS